MSDERNEVSRKALEEDGWHWRKPAPERPVFHYVKESGSHGVVGWDTVKVWAEEIYVNGVPRDFYYRELYVLLPGGRSLLPCAITIDQTGPFGWKAVVTGTASVSGELFRES
jgi:hypothetical protein